jgi:hypothetical protein
MLSYDINLGLIVWSVFCVPFVVVVVVVVVVVMFDHDDDDDDGDHHHHHHHVGLDDCFHKEDGSYPHDGDDNDVFLDWDEMDEKLLLSSMSYLFFSPVLHLFSRIDLIANVVCPVVGGWIGCGGCGGGGGGCIKYVGTPEKRWRVFLNEKGFRLDFSHFFLDFELFHFFCDVGFLFFGTS